MDQSLLVKCPIPNWIASSEADDTAIGNERYSWGVEYAKCKIRNDILVDRIQDMMNH